MAKRRQAVSGVKLQKASRFDGLTKKMLSTIRFMYRPRLILSSAFLLTLFLTYEQLSLQTVLPISSVKIEGEFKYLDKEKLQHEALPVVEGGFFSVNLAAVREALIQLPWVEDVSVRRLWPDQLLVRVMEKQPVVYWGDSAVLSSKGELFMPDVKLQDSLPRLTGPDGLHRSMFQELARMQAWLLETGLYIQEMHLDARRSWTLIMKNGLELRLGRQNMHERLQRFASVYKNQFQTETRKIRHIDMRYTNGFAVAWKEAKV